MKTTNHICERCGEVLKTKNIVWMELSITDGKFYTILPEGHKGQGAFPFGKFCASMYQYENKTN